MPLTMVDPSAFNDDEDAIGTDIVVEIQNILDHPIDLISPVPSSVNWGAQDITNLDNVELNSATFANSGVDPTVAGKMLRNGTILKVHDGAVVRVNQCLHAVGQSGIIQNTAVESELYSFSVPAGALGTLNKLQTKILFRVGLLSGASVQIVCYFDGALGASIGLANNSLSTAGLTLCPLTVTLSGNGATDTQILMAECVITNSVSNLANALASLCPNISHAGVLSVDSTLAKPFQINVLFNTADAANQCDYLGLTTMLVG